MDEKYTNRIARNVLSLSFGQGFSLVIGFFSITLSALYLGVSNFGLFSSVSAMASIIAKVTDLGFAPIVLREGTKKKSDFTLMNSSVTVRLVLIIIVFAGFNIVSLLFSFDRIFVILSDIMFLNIVLSSKFQNIRELMDIPFRIDLKMHYSMAVTMLDNTLFLLAVLVMPYFSGGIYYITISYVLANLPGFFVLFFLLKKKYGYSFIFDFSNVKWLIMESLPMWGFVLLTAVFQQMDVVFLKYFHSNYSAGIYSAAMRLSVTLIIIPYAVSTTVFPLIMKNIAENPERNQSLLSTVYKVLFFTAFVVAAICSFKAESIVTLLFGKEFAPASVPMILLLWNQIFIFYNYFSVDVFTAHNYQKFNFIYATIVILLNVLFMFMLIPGYTYSGMAAAKVLSSVLGTLLVILMADKIGLKHSFFSFRLLVYCFSVCAILYLLSILIPLIPYLLISGIVILLMIKIVRCFSDSEMLMILRMFKIEKLARYFI